MNEVRGPHGSASTPGLRVPPIAPYASVITIRCDIDGPHGCGHTGLVENRIETTYHALVFDGITRVVKQLELARRSKHLGLVVDEATEHGQIDLLLAIALALRVAFLGDLRHNGLLVVIVQRLAPEYLLTIRPAVRSWLVLDHARENGIHVLLPWIAQDVVDQGGCCRAVAAKPSR